MNEATQQMIRSGRYVEADDLADMQDEANGVWDEAEATGVYKVSVDAADLYKICFELTTRRLAEA